MASGELLEGSAYIYMRQTNADSDTNMILRPGGWSREITSRELPVSDTFSVVNMSPQPMKNARCYLICQLNSTF